jgi:DUF1365 family protein
MGSLRGTGQVFFERVRVVGWEMWPLSLYYEADVPISFVYVCCDCTNAMKWGLRGMRMVANKRQNPGQ